MRSKSTSVKLPWPIVEAIKLRAERENTTVNALITGLCRYDLMVQRPHEITMPISKMALEEQDKIDDLLLALTQRGISVRRSLLEHLVEKSEDAGTEGSKKEAPSKESRPKRILAELKRLAGIRDKPKPPVVNPIRGNAPMITGIR